MLTLLKQLLGKEMLSTSKRFDELLSLMIRVPPPRLERGLLPPEGSALSTELWGHFVIPKILP